MVYVVDYIEGYHELLRLEETQKIVVQPVRDKQLIVCVFDGKKPRNERLIRTLLRVEKVLVQVE